MKLGLSMIIKNEAKHIKKNIGDIYDLFDDIVIVDTGSTDNSVELLNDMGIPVSKYIIKHEDKRLIDARNFSIEINKCDWVLILDGDELISREDVMKIKDLDGCCSKSSISGYFIKWIDHRYGNEFDDYKMSLINKKKVRFLFSIHACPQVYIRDNHGLGLWMNGINIHHYPEPKEYRSQYIEQLENGIKENPGCLRFYWFMGYHYFKNNNIDKAIENLEFVVNNINIRFPVEILNSIMILSVILQKKGDIISSFYYISLGLEYYEKVQSDFEVKINFRLKYWFLDTQKQLINNPYALIEPYEFAY